MSNTKNINVNVQRPPTNIPLGRQGENRATCVTFDCTGLVQLYGDGTAELLHELKDGTIYPVAVTQDGASVSWTVSASDTATVGAGRVELRWYVGDTLAKSAKFRTSVSSALADSTTETPPEPQKSWVDKVLQAAQEIKDGAISEEQLADAIAKALADASASGEFDGAPGLDGADGGYYTPNVDNDGNLTWTASADNMPAVTGANIKGPQGDKGDTGATGAQGPAGADGSPGADGADGVGIQSVVQTTTSAEDGGTNVITVTKTDGTTSTFQVKNGSKGSDGVPGADGKDGQPGADGKSAYQYAKDGGYTGTEEEFAAKMAQEIPTVDATLTQAGQAADAAAVGEQLGNLSEETTYLKSDLGELKNVVGITEKQKIEWESGKVSATSDGFVYSGGANYARTKEPIKLKAGDSVSISDNTTYGFRLIYIAVDGTYGTISHPDWNPKIAQVDGDYCIVINTRDASSLMDKVQEVSSLITVEISQPLSGILGDMEKISNAVNEKQDTLIAGDGIRIAEDGKTISAVGGSGGNSILLSNILNIQSISAVAGSVTVENGIYTITANGTGSESRLIITQAYEANHKYMLIASVRGDYSEHKPASMYSRVEEGSINHFSEWVHTKNIPAANVSLDCRNCYHVFDISTSGSYRTSFTVNFGTNDRANGAVFEISNIALIDVTEIQVDYRTLSKAIFAQLNGNVTNDSVVNLDMVLDYPIQNYNIAFFGDSILGNYSEHEKLSVMSKANVYNFAIGGTTVTNGNALSLCNLIDAKQSGDFTAQDAVIGGYVNRLSMLKNFDFASLDYIVIEIGTNDWRKSYCKIGDDDSTDLKTIKGAYNHVLETIYAINPMIKVFILTPLYRTQFDANTTPNDYSGIYLYQVVDAIKEIAEKWGITAYDMYRKSGVNAANSTVYLLDGTHPTPVMEYRIVDIIYNLITQYIN